MTIAATVIHLPAAAAAPALPEQEMTVAAGDYVQRSGARSRDITTDGLPDILVRQPNLENGTLWAYPSIGRINGTSTLGARTKVGRGWNIYNWIGVAEVTGDTQEDGETVPEQPADILARRTSDGALLVYPHSGSLNGLYTFNAPVVVGRSGWNGMVEIVLADITCDGFDDILALDGADKLWLYPHSRTFDALNTFAARSQVRAGRLGYLFATEWSNDCPNLVTNYIATGDMRTSAHTRKADGLSTWASGSTQISSGQFTGDLLDKMSLADLSGDGLDDIVVRGLDGNLVVFPFIRINGTSTFGNPTVIGGGWHVMDVLT